MINCNKETVIEPLSDAKITARINGSPIDFEFKSAEFFYGDFRILAEVGDMSLTIFTEELSTGSFVFGIDQYNEAILFESPDNSVFFSSNCTNSNTGNILISSIDSIEKTISGSFHFDGCNTAQSPEEMTVTDGVFSDLKYSKSNLGGAIRGKLKLKQDNQLIAFRDVLCTGDQNKFAANAFLTNGKSFTLQFNKPGNDGSFRIDQLEEFSASYNNKEGNCIYLAQNGHMDIITKDNGTVLQFNLELINPCDSSIMQITEGVMLYCN